MEFLQEELDEILNIFSQESTEILQSMDKNLLSLEKKPNNADIAMHLFRDAHSLKGSARMLGFDDIQNIAHKIEDVLGLIKDKKIPINSNVFDIISSSLSFIDTLIKKTIEQKAEYKSEETALYIQKLSNLYETNKTDLEENNNNNQPEESGFKKNFEKFEDLITGIIFVYSKSVQDNNFEQFRDILNIIGELSVLSEEIQNKELMDISIAMSDLASYSIQENNENEEILYELNLKINEFIQVFNKLADENHLKTKNYYDNAYKISSDNKLQIEEAETSSDGLKNVELLELINKTKETIPEINNSKHSLAEVKSLLNEIVSRLKNEEFKKIYQTILAVVLNFEKADSKLKPDGIYAIKEIIDSTANIIDSKTPKNIYSDYTEEIELLNQKAIIIAQMIKYELKNPNNSIKSQRNIKTVDWSDSFDSSPIKTLRVNSDKLDKLVNQIGNLIVTRIKSHENVGLVKLIQDELIEWQKHYHKIGYYMKFYEKKYIQEALNEPNNSKQKKDSFLGYNKQLIGFHNANSEKMSLILNNLNILMKELQENNIKLNTVTSEIENMVKSMRILPLSTAFNLFPRMVHNIAKDKNKEIELIIEGAEVSADKKIIEDIKIPIMHIVRNSLDHGIETPRERERLGKARTGNIVIKASQRENKIVISVKDDGRGINISKIKQKAVEKGFLTPEDAESMAREQLANLIFYPGFSTGDSITELSGRGLGLDIVHTKISQLNGRIDVYSEENKGTIVTMELPTTMATLKTLIVMENNQLFAIPTSSIQTVLRISSKDIIVRDKRLYYIYNGEPINICKLSYILNLPSSDEACPKYTIMVLKQESITTGIIIQKLIGDEEILHKKLPEPLLRVKNISGITTLANGEMCLLLNVSDILSSNKINPKELNTTKSLTFRDNSKYKILIIDDSITTRRLLDNVLSSFGYVSDVESNPKEALKKLENTKYDLIISDYEMPEINGLEFVKILKEKEKSKNIPIIVLTSIEKQGLKEDFYKLGVQEFIKKEYFEQREFINIVNKYLNISL